MKSFRQYILEDIELMTRPYVPDTSGFGEFYPEHHLYDISSNFTGLKDPNKTHTHIGDLNDDYTLHRFTYEGTQPYSITDQHKYVVVHKPTNRVAAMYKAEARDDNRFPDVKLLKSVELKVHPDFRKRKTGVSLPPILYNRLSEMGHPIESSDLQSEQGANHWNKMRKDPVLGERMMLSHFISSGRTMTPAANLPDSEIWARPSGSLHPVMPNKIKADEDEESRKFADTLLRSLVLLPPKK